MPRDPRRAEEDTPLDRSPSAKKSWRGKSASGQTVVRHRWQRDWTKEQDADVQRRTLKHRLKVFGAWGLFVGLTLFFALILWYWPQQTPFVPIAVTDYDFPIPPNAFAREDVRRFDDLSKAPLAIIDGTGNPDLDWNSRWKNKYDALGRFRRSVEKAAQSSSARQVLVIYLSAHGVVDVDAEKRPRACLLPPGGAIGTRDWLPVAELLDVLKSDPALARRKKLLLLDAHRIDANWSLGQLYNGFAEALVEAFDKAEVPNLALLTSAAPGQLGWASHERQGSSFGYYTFRAFRGRADEQGNANGVTSLGELERYVQVQTDHWARVNRLDKQAPTLLAADLDAVRDWNVSHVPNSGLLSSFVRWWNSTPPEPVVGTPTDDDATRDTDLAALWDEHDVLEGKAAYRGDPLAWQLFERRLVWGEQLAAAGSDYDTKYTDNLARLKQLASDLRPKSALADNPASTMPLATALGGAPPELAAAKAAWDRCLSGANQSVVSKELEVLDGETPNAASYSEIQFLRLLANDLDARDWLPAATVERILAVRTQAEEVAAPADFRVAPWLVPSLDAADLKRRLAEDRLFVGGQSQRAEAVTTIDAASEIYERSARLGQSVSRAYAVRDRVAAEAPFLAAWLSRRLPGALDEVQRTATVAQLDPLLRDELLKLIDENKALSSELLDRSEDKADDETTVSIRTKSLDDEVAVIEGRLRRLQEVYSDECRDLQESGGGKLLTGPERLRRIGAVLSVPLIGGKTRRELRDNYAAISRTLYNNSLDDLPDSAAAKREGSATEGNAQLDRIASWGEGNHPAIAILTSALPLDKKPVWGPSNDALTLLAQQGDVLRQSLGSGTMGIDVLAKEKADTSIVQFKSLPADATMADVRSGFHQADHILRTMADMRPSPEINANNPVAQLRGFDLCYLLRWHARRAADDFYGSPPPAEDFFVVAAGRYLNAAESLLRSLFGNDATVKRERALVETRRAAAAEPALVQITDNDLVELSGDETRDIEHGLSILPKPGLPEGLIAVHLDLEREGSNSGRLQLALRDGTGSDAADYRIKAETPPNAQDPEGFYRFSYDIRREGLDGAPLKDVVIDAVAYLRGHVRKKQVETGAVIITFNPTIYAKPEVKVTRPAISRGELMFVFDCSGSMADPTSSGAQRITVARNALFGRDMEDGVLDRLANAGLYRVGLRLYGHRVGWTPKTNPPQVRRRDDPILELFPDRVNRERYLAELAAVRPGTDVDRVLPIGDFTEQELREVQKLLYNLKPWGITPLYYSIARALAEDFRPGTDASHRRIVVLTDGLDQQAQDKALKPEERINAAELKKLFEAHRRDRPTESVQLDVVGFELGEDAELKQIAKETGGEYHRASKPSELIAALERALGLSSFEVVSDSDENRTLLRGDFGKTLVVDPSPKKRSPYTVRVPSQRPIETKVELEGGESLLLELTEDNRLVHRRYEVDLREFAEHVRNPDLKHGPSELFIAAHQPPQRVGDEVRFPISLQNQEATEFSPRAVEVCAEITPVMPSASSPAQTYTYYDATYENGRPVPVLSFEVPDWPREALAAEVRVWCKYFPTEADHEVNVGDVADRRDLPSERRMIPNHPGVSFEVKTQQLGDPRDDVSMVIVTVNQPAGASGTEPLKVEMAPAPSAVVHHYFDSNRTSKHYFHYKGVSRGELRDRSLGDYRLRFTSPERLKQGAVRLEKPLTVRIPEY